MNSSNFYERYYNQHGRGLDGIGPLYTNPRFNQRGAGLGGFFQSLFSYVKPILQSGWQILKKQGVKTAAGIISDLGEHGSFKDALKNRSKEAMYSVRDQVVNKLQSGSGKFKKGLKRLKKKITKKKSIKPKASHNSAQSRGKRKNVNNNSKKRVLDIFS